MWLHPDVEIDNWICTFETQAQNPDRYIHSGIQPSSWRQIVAHSSVVVLNNFIFAQPLPWTVFQNTRSYAQYIEEFESLAESTAEARWYRRLNDHVRTPLAEFTHTGDPMAGKLIYIYAHLFGYDRDHAISLGLTPVESDAFAWPPKGLDGSWPAAFLHDDDGPLSLQPRPSLKRQQTQNAIANAVYFYLRHFESVGAKVHLSPWREVNGYVDATRCPDTGRCGLDSWQDLYDTYRTIVARVHHGDFDPARIAVYPTLQLESYIGIKNPCVDASVIDKVKRFYLINAEQDVPFAIGLSTYPSTEDGALEPYRSRLLHLLDSLDSSNPIACDLDGDGVIARHEGIDPDSLTPAIRVPRATPLTIGETSRPPWLSFQSQDTQSMKTNEKLGASMANTHLHYQYRAIDGKPAYPLEFVAFAVGPNWAFPVSIHGRPAIWLTAASGIARHWLTPMQPLAAQLMLDVALDPDGDWDNDGVPNISFSRNPFIGGRDARRGLDDFLYDLVRAPEGGLIKQRAELDDIAYTLDNCPYAYNPLQADADGDGIGNECDNCINVPNYAQQDWDQDGFGSACDPDVNNDGLLQPEVDLAVVMQCQGAAIDCLAHVAFPDLPPGQPAPELKGKIVLIADMDADEDVDEDDIAAWRRLTDNASLRESGYACAGSTPCPDPSLVMLRDGRKVTVQGPARQQRECSP